MPHQLVNTALLFRLLEDDTELAEAIGFPEVSSYARGGSPRARAAVGRHVRDLIERMPAIDLYRRRGLRAPAIVEIVLTIDPPGARREPGARDAAATAPPAEAWRTPIAITLHTLQWRHGEHACLANVPALGIEVIAPTPEELAERLPRHARFALMRSGAARSLWELAHLSRVQGVRVEPVELAVTLRSPKQAAIESAERERRDKPVIEQVGVNLSAQTLPPAWELDNVVEQLAEALSGRHPRSVLLVGKPGVGKTAALRELVRRRATFALADAPFWATNGSRLVAGMSGFGMWQARCRKLCQEANKAGAILCLGNLIELLEVGKSVLNAQGIGSFLRPYLARGEVLAVAECTQEQLPIVERTDPHLLEVFRRITVDEPAPPVARTILLNYVVSAEPNDASPIDETALETVDQLHRRYATYSSFPARPLRFLRNLLHDRKAERFQPAGEHWTPEPKPLTRQDVIAAFARETGLPRFMLDESVPLDLAETRETFARRVIGQEAGTDLVVDLIATVKAALNRPRRPIASLMFIGPTGVGKTEMAKALAEFFFGDANRLTRFDMSEFASPAAVERLVGGALADEGLLTARIREQPFSVVLLDEFEKAHPALFDLMLQVLGEGRLTDAAGRVADFTNAVVIMTSNLGAQSFRQAPFGLTRRATRASASHFLEEVRDYFRPELFNRIDRVVPFDPLDEATVLRIARREIDLVRRRDGMRLRGVALDVPEEAVRYLARRGFDPLYGARPLKRAIERELLVPLAEGLNGYAETAKLVASASVEGRDRLRVLVKAATNGGAMPAFAANGDASAATAAEQCATIRRDLQRLQQCAAVMALQNDIFALERLKERAAARQRRRLKARRRERGHAVVAEPFVYIEDERLARLPRLVAVADAIKALVARAVEIENDLLLGLYDPNHAAKPAADALPSLNREWDDVLLAVYALRFPKPHQVSLIVRGEADEYRFDLLAAYQRIALEAGCTVKTYWWHKADAKRLELRQVETLKDLRKGLAAESPAWALSIEGPYAYARFEAERGTHRFERQKKAVGLVMVGASDKPLAECSAAAGNALPSRRTYDLDNGFAKDERLRSPAHFPGSQWDQAIARCMAEQLAASMRAVVNE